MEDSVHCRVIARYTRMTHGGQCTLQGDSRYTWRTAYTILQDDSKVHTWSCGSLVPRRPGNEARSSGGQCTLQVASFLVPRPAFRRLQYPLYRTASDEKLGVGLGTRLHYRRITTCTHGGHHTWLTYTSLIPSPHPSICCLQY